MKKSILYNYAFAISISNSLAQTTEILYQNDFNKINAVSKTSSCSPNIKYNRVNDVFVGTGTGLYKDIVFGQLASVEIVDNYEPAGNIIDHKDVGGNHSITLQTANPENDLLWLNFKNDDIYKYKYLNFNLDISPTDILTSSRCGISGIITTPKVVISAYWNKTSFSSSSRGKLIATDTLIGLPPHDSFRNRKYDIYNWKNVTARLNMETNTDSTGIITLLIDVIQGSYTAIDNFLITSSQEAMSIDISTFEATRENNTNIIKWKIENPDNFSHFELETANIDDINNFKLVEKISFNNEQKEYKAFHQSMTTQFYRLKLIDNDNSYSYSKIIKVHSNKLINNVISIYPNPTSDNIYINNIPLNTNYKIYNTLGILMQSNAIDEYEPIDIKNLPKGNYYIILNVGSQIKSFTISKI